MFHAVVTSLLPMSVYRFVRQTHGCHCLSSVACIAVAFSLHLTILGTHTLVNSFLSPFFFFALALLSPVLVQTQIGKRKQFKNWTSGDDEMVDGKINEASCKAKNVKYTNHNSRGHNATVPAVGITLPVSAAGIQYYIEYLVCGFVLGIVCYIRIDMCITLALICVFFILTFSTLTGIPSYFREIFTSGVGVLLALALGGYEDHSRYGLWFLSPIQWLKFNFVTDLSSTLYGLQSPWMYVEKIFMEGAFTAVLYFASMFVLVFNFVKKEEKLSVDCKMTLSLVLSSMTMFLVYSRVGHKEVRFLHDFIVLQIVVVSSAGHLIIHRLSLSFYKKTFIIYAILSCHVINTLYQFSNDFTTAPKKWAYKNNISAGLNACIDFVSSREDVRGVLIDGSIYATGGFSLLRKDIPILIRIHHEYHEYGKESAALRNRHGLEQSSQLRVVSRLTDFVDISNVVYLQKILLEKNEYNYLVIMDRDVDEYSHLGYKREYSVGHFNVLVREVSKEKQLELSKLGSEMSVGSNATVLEYEGSWLFTSGVYRKAIQRLERSLELDDSRIRPFQLLGLSYIRLNQWDEARETEMRCFERHGEHACQQPQRRVVLHTK